MGTSECAKARTISISDTTQPLGWVTVAISDEIDIVTAPALLASLLVAARSGTAGVVVDVSAVTFMCAAGVNALISARNQERKHGRDLVVRAPPPMVARVLDIFDLNDLIELRPSNGTRELA